MNDYGYGLWFLVVINTAVILIFAASFFHPKTGATGGPSAASRPSSSPSSPRCTGCR